MVIEYRREVIQPELCAHIFDRAGNDLATIAFDDGQLTLEGGDPWMWEALVSPIERLEVLSPSLVGRDERITYQPGDVRHFKLIVTRWHQIARRHGSEQWAKWVEA